MKKREGYLTVEASLVFPIILIIYFYIFQLALVQFDRCILEQEVSRMIVTNSVVSNQRLKNKIVIAKEILIHKEDNLGWIKYSITANISWIKFRYDYQYFKMDPVMMLRLERKLSKDE